MLSYCLKTTIPVGWGGWVGELRNKTKLQPRLVWLELELSLAILDYLENSTIAGFENILSLTNNFQ